ncbi:M23 family metallopeptidase [Streptomyces sp. NPDC057682]|uniref:M23 family metallopeptidase n=1 Tax=Streptomyces sp. NPDC057682 TaxID=3346210 RepID=UPI003682FEFF
MNDQPPYAGYAGYDSHSTGSFDSDPLFGSLPGGHDASYDTSAGYASPYATEDGTGYTGTYEAYGTAQWDTGGHPTVGYGHTADYTAYTAQPQQHPSYDAYGTSDSYDATGSYGTTDTYATTDTYTATGTYGTADSYDPAVYDTGATWLPTDGALPTVPAQGGAPDSSGQWDTTAWYADGRWAATDTARYDTGAYDATAWNTGAEAAPHDTYEHSAPTETAVAVEPPAGPAAEPAPEPDAGSAFDPYEPYRAAAEAEHTAADDAGHGGRPVRGRSRRRSPAKRSALLTVAVPSACVMSVAGIAAASVGGIGGLGGGEEKKDDTMSMAAADPGTVKPVAANNKLDTQLANLSADAENFADRASRTQERIDLKARQAAEKKKREEEAARKEALRPKFVLPVKQHGLSAYFGQAGVNWMSVHTGIDFPVGPGTPVMAATDGTVRTQFNSAYGNMAIVTMADGTETWYCHLSSTRIRSGPVKAGDVIAYSGDTGNSTGPHLHFEVRPGGGAAINPLTWLRSHGVNPT